MSDTHGPIASVTMDGFTISDSSSTADEIRENLEATEAPLDGDPKEAEDDETSKAAARLGKKGGEAAAKSRAKAEKEAKRAAKDAKEPTEDAETATEAVDDDETVEEKPGNPRSTRNAVMPR